MKKWLSLLFAIMVLLGLMSLSVSAEELQRNTSLQEESIPGQEIMRIFWENPETPHHATKEELFASDDDVSASAVSTPVSPTKAISQIRQQMAQRVSPIEVTIQFDSDSQFESFNSTIWTKLYQHTGVPNQGDYLKKSTGASGGSWFTTSTSRAYSLKLNVEYYTSASQENYVASTISQVLSNIGSYKTDYEKVKYIVDYICGHVTYDFVHLNDDSYLLQYTAYAALANRTAVCQGYACLFYRMSLTAGVDARYVSSIPSECHGWNIAKLGNKYYWIDTTWESQYREAGKYNNTWVYRGTNNFPDHTPDNTKIDISGYPISAVDYDPVAAALSFVEQPQSVSEKLGGIAVFNVTVNGSGAINIQWQHSTDNGNTWVDHGIPITDRNSSFCSIIVKEEYAGYKFRCIVSNSWTTIISSVATLTIKPDAPTIVTQPSSLSGFAGDTVIFKVVASGSGTLKYQWEYSTDGGNTWLKPSAASATTAAYSVTLKNAYNGYLYRCRVTNSSGTSTTSIVKLTVKPTAPTITTQPSSLSGYAGNTVTFKVNASGSATLNYQWEYSTDGGTTWLKPGAASATTNAYSITLKDAYNGYRYRCKVTNAGGTATTSVVKLTVKPTAPKITTQPTSLSGYAGDIVTFKVAASGSATLKYQWEYSTDGGTTWLKPGADSATTKAYSVTLKDAYNGYKYRCKVTNSAGTATSSIVKLTVKPTAPKITTQPSSLSSYAGDIVTFKVAASGSATLKYQWEYSKDGGTTWLQPGADSAKTAAYSVTLKDTYNGYKYRCKVTNSAGTATSSIVKLTVKPTAPKITTQPSSLSGYAGDIVTFKVAASGSATLKYQWEYSKDGGTTWLQPGADSAKTAAYSVTLKDAYNGYRYRCKVTNSGGTVTSAVVKLTVTLAPPSITTQPKSISGYVGDKVTFKVAASGTGTLAYQWEYSKDGGTTWQKPSAESAATAAYSVTLKDAYNGYRYRCKVTNSGGTVTSSVVKLTVTFAPLSITMQPQNISGFVGDRVTFKVAASGIGSLTYQWEYSKDGGASWQKPSADSAKTAAYSVTLKDTYNGYVYRCIVTDSSGFIASSVVSLTVF